MQNQKKIFLISNTLSAGGAERMLLNLASELSQIPSFSITFITTSGHTPSFFNVPEGIKHISLSSAHTKNIALHILQFIKKTFKLRQLFQKQNAEIIVISFLENINILNIISTLGLRAKSIISIRNHPQYKSVPFWIKLLRRLFYPVAETLVVQTESIKKWCTDRKLNKNIIVIPNFLSHEFDQMKLSPKLTNEDLPYFFSIGRLHEQKGFDTLLEAIAILLQKGLQAKCKIIGTGPQLDNLKIKISKLHLNEIVTIIAPIRDAKLLYQQGNIFILSSKYEGFPNVLLEAMSMGIPVISTNCPSGPSEIIENNINGILVPVNDPQSMALAMEKLISDPELCLKLAKEATKVSIRYHRSSIIKMWIDCIKR